MRINEIVNISYKRDGAWLNINPVEGAKCSLNILQLSSKFNGVVRQSLLDLCQEHGQTETDLTELDKPFGELDRATQLKLVEHVLDGGRVECTVFGNVNCMFRELKTLDTGMLFQNNYTYRAIRS